MLIPEFIDKHDEHTPHGSPVEFDSQFIAFANIFAVEVLPVPLVPQNKYA
jgi:hypothetical protein